MFVLQEHGQLQAPLRRQVQGLDADGPVVGAVGAQLALGGRGPHLEPQPPLDEVADEVLLLDREQAVVVEAGGAQVGVLDDQGRVPPPAVQRGAGLYGHQLDDQVLATAAALGPGGGGRGSRRRGQERGEESAPTPARQEHSRPLRRLRRRLHRPHRPAHRLSAYAAAPALAAARARAWSSRQRRAHAPAQQPGSRPRSAARPAGRSSPPTAAPRTAGSRTARGTPRRSAARG